MSRSRKKTPVFGNANGSEKQDKRKANRKLRKLVSSSLRKMRDIANEEEEILLAEEQLPQMREASDTWNFQHDGKHFWEPSERNSEDLEYDKEIWESCMRK